MSFYTTVNAFKKQVPVDFDALCKALEIDLVKRSDLPDTVSGHIVRTGRHSFSIELNTHGTLMRQRFSCAHMVGLVLLNQFLIKDRLILDNHFHPISDSYLKEQHRSSANRFAASLLMPYEWINEQYLKGFSIEEMAKTLQVNTRALEIRLKAIEQTKFKAA